MQKAIVFVTSQGTFCNYWDKEGEGTYTVEDGYLLRISRTGNTVWKEKLNVGCLYLASPERCEELKLKVGEVLIASKGSDAFCKVVLVDGNGPEYLKSPENEGRYKDKNHCIRFVYEGTDRWGIIRDRWGKFFSDLVPLPPAASEQLFWWCTVNGIDYITSTEILPLKNFRRLD
jgi:hypothetical protein